MYKVTQSWKRSNRRWRGNSNSLKKKEEEWRIAGTRKIVFRENKFARRCETRKEEEKLAKWKKNDGAGAVHDFPNSLIFMWNAVQCYVHTIGYQEDLKVNFSFTRSWRTLCGRLLNLNNDNEIEFEIFVMPLSSLPNITVAMIVYIKENNKSHLGTLS